METLLFGDSDLRGLQAESLNALAATLIATGHPEEARTHLDQAAEVAAKTGSPGARVLNAIYRAQLRGEHTTEARALLDELQDRVEVVIAMEARFALWRLDNTPEDLAEAKRLLQSVHAHSPAGRRDSLSEDVSLHRQIAACGVAPESM